MYTHRHEQVLRSLSTYLFSLPAQVPAPSCSWIPKSKVHKSACSRLSFVYLHIPSALCMTLLPCQDYCFSRTCNGDNSQGCHRDKLLYGGLLHSLYGIIHRSQLLIPVIQVAYRGFDKSIPNLLFVLPLTHFRDRRRILANNALDSLIEDSCHGEPSSILGLPHFQSLQRRGQTQRRWRIHAEKCISW
jgi:hypothetical protein